MADEIKTQDDDLVIKNEYANPNDAGQYATSPNTTTEAANSNTGSGASAPEIELGNGEKEQLKYSWESKAEDRADLSYQSDVLTTKSNMLENRQNLEAQGQQYQDQVAMDQYSKNQSAEKAGWAGGYVLDTERQMNYLKQTIQSQMYGQMELQKYGYNTSLAAARLAYDTNRFDLALEYYNTALSRAVSEAEITGYYVSPEASEMLDQYSMASRTMNDESASEEEKQRADKILAAVYEWFEANGISKNGVETYQHLVEERTHRLSVEQTLEYINQANKQIDSNTFTRVDANGNAIFSEDGNTVETINFKTMDMSDILKYTTNNDIATQQYYAYLDTKITQQTQDQFTDWLITNKLLDKIEGNKGFSAKTGVNYENQLYKFLENSDVYKSLIEEFSNTDLSIEEKESLRNMYENWDFEIEMPDGTTIQRSFKDLQTAMVEGITPNGDAINNAQKNTGKIGNNEINYSVVGDITFTSLMGNQVWHAAGNNFGKPDIDIKANGNRLNYDVEVTADGKISGTSMDTIRDTYKGVYGEDMKCGTIFMYQGELYMYLDGTQQISWQEDYLIGGYSNATNEAWKIQEATNNCHNGQMANFKKDLKSAGITW